MMEKSKKFFYVRVPDETKRSYDELCKSRDETPSAAIRRLIREELAKEDRKRKPEKQPKAQ